jgi:F-type H+-transporting ATPase subunit a
VLVLVFLLSLPWASQGAASEDSEDLDAVHHVADGYYLDFSPIGKIELPRIFLLRREDGGLGLAVYASTTSAVASGAYAVEFEESGQPAPESAAGDAGGESEDSAETADAGVDADPLDGRLVARQGQIVVDLSITRHLVFAWLGALIVILVFVTLARRYNRGVGRETAPKGLLHNMFEALFIFVRDEIARPNLGDKADRFVPYLATAFFFILTCNLVGLVPFGATATANISITAVLAAFTFVITQFSASRDHWLHLFGPPGTPFLVRIILFPVEFMSLFTKPIALAIRLFANMTAGHLVILSLIGLIFTFAKLFGDVGGFGIAPVSVAFALGIYLLELLVASIQAYIFAMLSALFIGMAIEEHGHDDAHGHDEVHGRSTPPAMATH